VLEGILWILRSGARWQEAPKPTQRELSGRVKVFLAPEFVHRITKIVHFNPLSSEAIWRRVARKEIGKVLQRDGIWRGR
jgi:ATP-dependent Clp protease ATP-binding subunit ClpA